MGVVEELVRARETYERGDWAASYDAWSSADPATLDAGDLTDLAVASHLVGDQATCVDAWQRAFHLHAGSGRTAAAVRCAFHLAMLFSTTGEVQVGAGWTTRAARLLEDLDSDTVEHGFVAFARMHHCIATGDWDGASRMADDVVARGKRFADPDLTAVGLAAQGRMRLYAGSVPEGLGLFDEAMVGVAAGEVAPIFVGHVYCVMIEGCQEVADLARAAAWTTALSRWSADQPGLVAFTGQCAVHRGQIMRLHGEHRQAIGEFDAAIDRYLASPERLAAGLAFAERGDVLRVLGDFDGADESYDRAADLGHEPQPGLALLWAARGRTRAAAAAVRRLLGETTGPVPRARLLPAAVEILLPVDTAEARVLAAELEQLAVTFGCEATQAHAAYALGAVELAGGDAAGALPYLRKAASLWRSLECPYELARCRSQVGLALRALGDDDSAAGEIAAAQRAFAAIGAAPDAERAALLAGTPAPPDGLTGREVEVLRLVAAGRSNAQIADQLTLSTKTVARHLSNIFTKLDVGSRTAAAAYAFEHGLV